MTKHTFNFYKIQLLENSKWSKVNILKVAISLLIIIKNHMTRTMGTCKFVGIQYKIDTKYLQSKSRTLRIVNHFAFPSTSYHFIKFISHPIQFQFVRMYLQLDEVCSVCSLRRKNRTRLETVWFSWYLEKNIITKKSTSFVLSEDTEGEHTLTVSLVWFKIYQAMH